MIKHRLTKLLALAIFVPLLSIFSGCATPPTAVTAETEFQPNEGLVTLRIVDLGTIPIRRFTVVSEQTGQEYPLRQTKFGQTSTMTYVGRLPAGRYRPKQLFGSSGMVRQTVPLAELTGKFDVEIHRVTDLGTMVFMEIQGSRRDEMVKGVSKSWTTAFALPLDRTPVPTEQLLAARFPQLAKAISGKSTGGWVAGTVPIQPAGLLDRARAAAHAATQPSFLPDGAMLAGGPLGVVAKLFPSTATKYTSKNDTVHVVESVLALKDGRWLAGGEEGYLAVSGDEGASWQRLAGLASEEVVIHLSQAADGRLFMVTDLDREAVVYESASTPIAWKVIRRIPSEREQGAFTQEFGEAAKFLRDFAAVSRDRLVVHTRPNMLSSLDLRTGQWEVQETPRSFHSGIKLTPDGYLVGIFGPAWVYASPDYGKNWDRLEAWVSMSQPHFMDRNRGVVISADLKLTGKFATYYRSTEDGGKSWKTGPEAKNWMASQLPMSTLQPLWTDVAGTTLFTTPHGRIVMSTDQGQTWR